MKKQIGSIAIAILAGACALVCAYNVGSVKSYAKGKAMGMSKGFEGGWEMGWNEAVSTMKYLMS